MQKLLYIIALLAIQRVSAQSVTGSWYGRADVELSGLHSNYLTELVVKQTGNRVDGVFGYYFRDKYQSFFVHGRYNPKTRQVIIENIPVIYYNSNSTVNSIDCNTTFIGVIVRSQVSSTLKGAFYHDEKYKYTCPDLKVTYTLDREDKKQDSLINVASVNSRVWKPQVGDVVVDVAATDQVVARGPAPEKGAGTVTAVVDTVRSVEPSKPAEMAIPRDTMIKAQDLARLTDTVRTHETIKEILKPVDTTSAKAAESVAKTAESVAKAADDPAKIAEKEAAIAAAVKAAEEKKINDSYTKRKAVLTRVLELESDSVRVSFYDNGEIDGDSISVFVNNHVVLTHQELASKALTMYLKLDSAKEVTDLSMFAENLGKYPPNTALMVVTDGKNRYEVYMSSSLTENATIQLKRKQKAQTTGPGRRL